MEFEQFLSTTFTGAELCQCGAFFAAMSSVCAVPWMFITVIDHFCIWLRTRKKRPRKGATDEPES